MHRSAHPIITPLTVTPSHSPKQAKPTAWYQGIDSAPNQLHGGFLVPIRLAPLVYESLGRVRMRTVLYRIVRHLYTFFTDFFVLRHWHQIVFRLNNNDLQRFITLTVISRRGAMQSQLRPSFAVISHNHPLDAPGESWIASVDPLEFARYYDGTWATLADPSLSRFRQRSQRSRSLCRGSRRGVDDVEQAYAVREKQNRSALPAEVERREHIRKEIMGLRDEQIASSDKGTVFESGEKWSNVHGLGARYGTHYMDLHITSMSYTCSPSLMKDYYTSCCICIAECRR